jgi:hypothetical protein
MAFVVLISRAGADDKEEFMATMVDENDRTKFVGEMHNIQGWTKYVQPHCISSILTSDSTSLVEARNTPR